MDNRGSPITAVVLPGKAYPLPLLPLICAAFVALGALAVVATVVIVECLDDCEKVPKVRQHD